MHRIDLETAANPTQSFNNYGGGNFWPAPEGGQFGFNYINDEWYVQEMINRQPFEVVSAHGTSAVIEKRGILTNRAGASFEVSMHRELTLSSVPSILNRDELCGAVTYSTVDSFEVLDEVKAEQALIAAWTLEQFDATESTLSFCKVSNPECAINFDFYEHPGERIVYGKNGFTYRTDGLYLGQIGIKKESGASFIGFCDLPNRVLCLRENAGPMDGLRFNIADNDQPLGPFSAADSYSIYNSAPEMGAFELETVGTATVLNGLLNGSQLISHTTLAVFREEVDLEGFVNLNIGSCTTA
jgi:hypothetical protein